FQVKFKVYHKTIHIDQELDWPGLPSGVKFDPTDVELLDHLAAKCGVGSERPHEFIDVFIPTIDVEQGICYKHPENLPGTDEDEKDSEYVVSKIFYQAQKDTDENTNVSVVDEESDPKTPMINACDPLGPGKTPLYEDVTCDYVIPSPQQEPECYEQKYVVSFPTAELKDDPSLPVCRESSNAIDLDAIHNSFSVEDNMNAHYSQSGLSSSTNDAAMAARDVCPGTAELENLDLGSPPFVNLALLWVVRPVIKMKCTTINHSVFGISITPDRHSLATSVRLVHGTHHLM
ncbi:hypothetical protein M8C21_025820, partial [Ambrosia artemisiifolia]